MRYERHSRTTANASSILHRFHAITAMRVLDRDQQGLVANPLRKIAHATFFSIYERAQRREHRQQFAVRVPPLGPLRSLAVHGGGGEGLIKQEPAVVVCFLL